METENTPSVAPQPPKRRCIAYVDGFNFYHRICKDRPEWKWFDFQSFFERLHRHEDVVRVKYFTTPLESDLHIVGACERQQIYLSALRSLKKVRIILGKFQPRDVTCRGRCKETYKTPEEKKTDVNIAVHLLNDAVKNEVDSVVIVSGDSDLEPAVFWVSANFPTIKITVYIPCLPESQKRRIDAYAGSAVACRFLPLAEIANHMQPDEVHIGSQVFAKPTSWTKRK